jgi:hypothetical protein
MSAITSRCRAVIDGRLSTIVFVMRQRYDSPSTANIRRKVYSRT